MVFLQFAIFNEKYIFSYHWELILSVAMSNTLLLVCVWVCDFHQFFAFFWQKKYSYLQVVAWKVRCNSTCLQVRFFSGTVGFIKVPKKWGKTSWRMAQGWRRLFHVKVIFRIISRSCTCFSMFAMLVCHFLLKTSNASSHHEVNH